MLPNNNPNLYWVSIAFDLGKVDDIQDNDERLLELQKLRSKITQEGIHSAIFDVQPIIGWKEVHEGKLSPVLAFGVVPYESRKAWIYDAHFGRIIDRDGKVKRVSEWIMADILEPVLQMISRSYGIETRPIR